MKISIVIATFNVDTCLATCLDSCINQTWPNREIIIIDGGSTDDTVAIIQRYASHVAFWQSEQDRGVYDAWNKALSHVTGDWVLFRGADDVFWDSQSLQRVVSGLAEASPTELICYGSVVCVDDDQHIVAIQAKPWSIAKRTMCRRMSIPHTGTFHHVELFRRFGGFDVSYRIAGDYEFLLRVLSIGGVDGKFIPGVIVTKFYVGGLSHTRGLLTKRESITALRRHGVSRIPMAQYLEILLITLLGWRKGVLKLLVGDRHMARLRRQHRTQRSERLRAITSTIQGDI